MKSQMHDTKENEDQLSLIFNERECLNKIVILWLIFAAYHTIKSLIIINNQETVTWWKYRVTFVVEHVIAREVELWQ